MTLWQRKIPYLNAHSRSDLVPAESAVLRRTKLVNDRTKLVGLMSLIRTAQTSLRLVWGLEACVGQEK